MKKRVFSLLLSLILVAAMCPAYASADTVTNKEAAMQEFGIPESRIMESSAATAQELQAELNGAASLGSAESMAMVHVSGNIEVNIYRLTVPENVVLCAEDSSTFGFSYASSRILVNGSVYGGAYEGNGTAGHVFIMESDFDPSGKNGIIEKTAISGPTANGIFVNKGSGSKIIGNTITGCGVNGIRVAGGDDSDSNIYMVKDNTIVGKKGTASSQSGLDIHVSSVNYVIGNTIRSNQGHGISTSTEGDSSIGKPRLVGRECVMNYVEDNTISDNGTQGIWLEYNCKIKDSFKNNKISGNTSNGLAMGAAAYVRNAVDNEIYDNGRSNLSLVGEARVTDENGNEIAPELRTSIELVSGNRLYGSREKQGIATAGPVSIEITGTGNEVCDNKSNQIHLQDGAEFTIASTGGLLIQAPSDNTSPALSIYGENTKVTLANLKMVRDEALTSIYSDGTAQVTIDLNSCTITGKVSDCVIHQHKPVTVSRVPATMTKDGKTAYKKCSECGEITDAPATIYAATTVSISSSSFVYTGTARVPGFIVKDRRGNTISSSNYSVAYASNTKVGLAKAAIRFKGNYSGSKSFTYRILPKKPAVKTVTAGKKSMTVKASTAVAKTGGTTYQIAYRVKGTSKWYYTTTTKQSKVIKKLKKKKKYQVKIRAYRTVNKVKYYGAWSAVKTTAKIK